MRPILILIIAIHAMAVRVDGGTLPELEEVTGSFDKVTVDAWVTLPEKKRRHLKLETDSREIVQKVVSFLKGLDCVPISRSGGLSTNDVVGITLESKGKSITLNILAGALISIPERNGLYEIQNISGSAGQYLMRKLMNDCPDHVKEVPRRALPP